MKIKIVNQISLLIVHSFSIKMSSAHKSTVRMINQEHMEMTEKPFPNITTGLFRTLFAVF